MVGLMRIVVGASIPVFSTSSWRFAEPRRSVFTIRHSMKRSRQRGLSLDVTCLAMLSAGWSSWILWVTNRTEPLYWSGVIFSASWNALTILVLSSLAASLSTVSYTHLRAHETRHELVC